MKIQTKYFTLGYCSRIGKVTDSERFSPFLIGHLIPSSQPLAFGKENGIGT